MKRRPKERPASAHAPGEVRLGEVCGACKKRHVEDERPPEGCQEDEAPFGERLCEGGRAAVLEDERVERRADEPVDDARDEHVRDEVRAFHDADRAAQEPEGDGEEKCACGSTRSDVLERKVEGNEDEARARVSRGPAAAGNVREAEGGIRHRKGAAEGLDRPGARDARRALEPPDCGGTGAHCDDDVECASRGLLLENPAALGEHDGETDEKHRRNDGGHELRKPVEDRREDFVPVPGPAVAEEELRDGEVEGVRRHDGEDDEKRRGNEKAREDGRRNACGAEMVLDGHADAFGVFLLDVRSIGREASKPREASSTRREASVKGASKTLRHVMRHADGRGEEKKRSSGDRPESAFGGEAFGEAGDMEESILTEGVGEPA